MKTGTRAPDYCFVDRWRVRGTAEEVADILKDIPSMPRWWPSTYLSIIETDLGDEDGVGRTGSVHAKGWLPYTIRFNYLVARADHPRRFELEAWGDLSGQGVWDIEQNGEWVDVTYTWTVQSSKPIVRYLSFLFRPIFRSNHNWTMGKGETSMQLELERRRAKTSDDLSRIPPPPGPVSNFLWAGGSVLVIALFWTLASILRRPSA